MYWSAEEFVLVITAFLFLGLVASSFLPRVELTPTSRATFAIGAAVSVGSAALLARIEVVQYPPLLWALPAIPMAIAGVLARDALTRRGHVVLPPQPQDQASRLDLRGRAADPHTSPQELASLAYSHPEVRATIAGNPATPANLLEWLAAVGDPAVHAAISAREPAPIAGRVTT
ncbi:MAG: hypothetical protein ACK4MD_07995 [Demequina sp.]